MTKRSGIQILKAFGIDDELINRTTSFKIVGSFDSVPTIELTMYALDPTTGRALIVDGEVQIMQRDFDIVEREQEQVDISTLCQPERTTTVPRVGE